MRCVPILEVSSFHVVQIRNLYRSPTVYVQVTISDVSHHAKSLVLIIEHNLAKQQRLTAAKLVDIWRGQQGGSGSSRPRHVSSANMPTQQCERVVVTALLQGALVFYYLIS